MSLINDALKRTQDNTRGNLPPRLVELELRPIEPLQPPPARVGGGRIILWIVVVLVVIGNVALFAVFKAVNTKQQVAARMVEEQFEVALQENRADIAVPRFRGGVLDLELLLPVPVAAWARRRRRGWCVIVATRETVSP